jgi:surface carbohydrate biosynthesis protein
MNKAPGASIPLLLPVETTNRELDSKLLLALFAVGRGFQPIVGGRATIHGQLDRLPRSIYLAKDARSGSRRLFSRLSSLGHIIVAADEEALVRNHDEIFLRKLDPETLKHVKLLIAWGESNKEIARTLGLHDAATAFSKRLRPRRRRRETCICE